MSSSVPLSAPDFLEHRLSAAAPVLVLPQMAKAGSGKHMHSHPEGQLYVAFQGLIVAEAGGIRSVLPPGRISLDPAGRAAWRQGAWQSPPRGPGRADGLPGAGAVPVLAA